MSMTYLLNTELLELCCQCLIVHGGCGLDGHVDDVDWLILHRGLCHTLNTIKLMGL
ncbi:hypothetical protein DPMN_049649 [Dreissena polymorpha]|uniref:Uncharacterized protein n=1 Tax=Dreissena polymorpha TaxID=45954 RepID=A0A9D4CFP7_DREPO|nr:hypothetical protein DPMN_049649 [Dreissena polymorpha]